MILQYCQERGVTPFLHGFNMRPKRYTRLFELKLGERDAETWGQPFDSPEAKKSQPISVGTLADVPEEIDNYFFISSAAGNQSQENCRWKTH